MKNLVKRIYRELYLFFNNKNNININRINGEKLINELNDIEIQVKQKKLKKILFCTTSLGVNANSLAIESYLIKIFRENGYDCNSLICGAAVPSCEFNIYGDGKKSIDTNFKYAITAKACSSQCNTCTSNVRRAIKAVGADDIDLSQLTDHKYEYIEEMINDLDIIKKQKFIYKNVNVCEHAYSSTLRITLRGEIDLNNNEERRIYKRQLISCIKMVDILNKLFDNYKPDRIIAVHGIYLSHGIIVDICKVRNIPITVYGAPYKKNTLIFSESETYHRSLIDIDCKKWMDIELDEFQNSELDKYLMSKLGGGRDNVNYHPNPILKVEDVVENLNLDLNKKIITLLTNVIWDAQIYYNGNVFNDIFEWLFETIDWFILNSDIQLIIRIHPAETKGGLNTRQPIKDEIKKKYPHLPKNIFIVSSNSNISTYTLAEMSHACLVYGTKMALEIATMGIPVIVAGETFSKGKGFTYDVKSKIHYMDLLKDSVKLKRYTKEKIDIARKFAYYYFFMRMIDIPGINIKVENIKRMDSYFYKIDEQSNFKLKEIAESIVGGREVVN